MYMSDCTFAMSDCISQMLKTHFGTKLSSVSVVSVQYPSINVSLYKVLLQQRVHGTNACVSVQWEFSKNVEEKTEK